MDKIKNMFGHHGGNQEQQPHTHGEMTSHTRGTNSKADGTGYPDDNGVSSTGHAATGGGNAATGTLPSYDHSNVGSATAGGVGSSYGASTGGNYSSQDVNTAYHMGRGDLDGGASSAVPTGVSGATPYGATQGSSTGMSGSGYNTGSARTDNAASSLDQFTQQAAGNTSSGYGQSGSGYGQSSSTGGIGGTGRGQALYGEESLAGLSESEKPAAVRRYEAEHGEGSSGNVGQKMQEKVHEHISSGGVDDPSNVGGSSSSGGNYGSTGSTAQYGTSSGTDQYASTGSTSGMGSGMGSGIAAGSNDFSGATGGYTSTSGSTGYDQSSTGMMGSSGRDQYSSATTSGLGATSGLTGTTGESITGEPVGQILPGPAHIPGSVVSQNDPSYREIVQDIRAHGLEEGEEFSTGYHSSRQPQTSGMNTGSTGMTSGMTSGSTGYAPPPTSYETTSTAPPPTSYETTSTSSQYPTGSSSGYDNSSSQGASAPVGVTGGFGNITTNSQDGSTTGHGHGVTDHKKEGLLAKVEHAMGMGQSKETQYENDRGQTESVKNPFK